MARYDSEVFLGKRPDCTLVNSENPDREHAFADALRYAHDAFEPRELKAFACEYLERDDLRVMPDYHFATIGKVAWVALEGGTLELHNREWIARKLAEIERASVPVEAEVEITYDLTTRQRDVMAYVDLYSALDRLIAAGTTDGNAVRELINRHDAKAGILKQTLTHFQENLTDAQADGIQEWLDPLAVVISELESRVYNQKVARIAGRKVTGKVARVIKNVKFRQRDATYNLVSVNPADIVGAKAVVTFNVKTKRIGWYHSDTTLDIQGTTIRDFSETLSFSKGTRNPQRDLDAIKGAGGLRRVGIVLDKHITGKRYDISGRLNDDTVILKVFPA